MSQVLLDEALSMHGQGRLAEAERLYEQALASTPSLKDARHMLGVLRAQQGRHQEALGLIAPVVAANPSDLLASVNLGNVLNALGRWLEALENYDRALALAPNYADAWCNRGNVLQNMGRLKDALRSYDRALSLNPNFMMALNNRGNTLMNLGRYEEALGSYDYALALNAGHPEVHIHRADALQRLCRFEEALGSYDNALNLSPDNPDVRNNRGVALQQLGRLDEAMDSFARAERLVPGMPQARVNRARLYLLQQNFEKGWPLLEARKHMSEPRDARIFAQPLWTGVEDINGKILFAYIDCGLGDAIQFYRYAPLAEARGAKVILSINTPLLPLLQSATPPVSMLPMDQVPDRFDYHIPLMSMPLALGINIPETGRYLAAEPVRVAKWRDRLGVEGHRVAIAWQGDTVKGAEGKSFPVSALAKIAAIPGIRLISLQKHAGAEQLEGLPLSMAVETFAEFDDGPRAFVDSAAILENCDLLISCDTALAHLAGALGIPNWIALKYVPDWRWFLERSDTPWYPNTRLFRQAALGDWDSVFRAMEAELISALP
jgi:tetratricopeptide (TPR) repeat protein